MKSNQAGLAAPPPEAPPPTPPQAPPPDPPAASPPALPIARAGADALVSEAIDLLSRGMSARDTAQETELPLSQVSALALRLRQERTAAMEAGNG